LDAILMVGTQPVVAMQERDLDTLWRRQLHKVST
jgi:hypothetical protein